MAANDVTVTPANVRTTSNSQIKSIQFGETVIAGAWLYRKASDNKYYLAQSDGTAEEAGDTEVVWSLSGGALDEFGVGVFGGNIIIGGTLTKGLLYVLSDTLGLITLAGDLAFNQFATFVGQAETTTELKIIINADGSVGSP